MRQRAGEQRLGSPLDRRGSSTQELLSASLPQTPIEMTPAPVIKAEPKEVNQFINVPTGKRIEFAGQLTSLYTTRI